jgi:signal transduction histidine kinase/ligand-binding sensor domain-containing protein
MFDGTHFRNFLHDPNNPESIGGSRVFKIQEDGNDKLWIATENFGLSRIDLKTFKIKNFSIPVNFQLEDRYINTLFIDEKGLIWIGTQTGVSYFDPVKEEYTKVPIDASVDEKEIVAFAKDSRGLVWSFGYTGQIFFKKPDEKIFKKLNLHTSLHIVNSAVKISDSNILLATSKGILRLELNPDPARSKLHKFSAINGSDPITDLAIDRNGTLWIANEYKGIQLFYTEAGILQNLNISWLSPIEPGIADWKDIMIDNSGGIWLGGEYGLYYYNSDYNQFNVYKAIAKFNDQFSFGKYVGISNFKNHIVSVTSRGISVYDRSANDFIYLKLDDELKDKSIFYNGIIQVDSTKWWVASSFGILELKKRNIDYLLKRPDELRSHPVLGKKTIYGISAAPEDKFWIATPENGLLFFDKKNRQTQNILEFGTGVDKKKIEHLDFVTTSPDGDIAVGHHRGFAIKFHDQKSFQHVEQLIGQRYDFSKLSVYDMEYKGDYLWIASESDGLFRFDLKRKLMKVFTMEDGLVSNSITAIHGMGKDKLIIGTNRGMSVMHIPSETFTTFLKKDGLPSEEFEIAVDHDIGGNEFFMATTKGIVSFFNNNLQQSVIKPKLILYAVVRNGKILSDSIVYQLRQNPQFKLKYNESLNLQFSTLNFSGDNDFILRFKMKDEDEWRTSSTSESLSLFNLDAGNYDIVIQLIGRQSGIMSEQLRVKLEVLPSFFKTRLFRIILLLLILTALYFPVNSFFRKRLLRQQQDLEKKKLLEQERVRIAMDLHDDIGGNLTALTLMTSLLKEKAVDPSGKLLVEKIGEASDKMVQDMNEIVWALNSTNDSLSSLMSYMRQQISQKLSEAEIVFEILEPISYPDMFVSGRARRNIYMIIKEIINNAVKYADSRIIEMKVVQDKKLKITISDNGKGMPYELTNQTIKGGGNGLNNIRKRADNIGASVFFKNEKGVTAIFEIPLDQFNS